MAFGHCVALLLSVPPACPQLEFGVIYHCTEGSARPQAGGARVPSATVSDCAASGETGGPSHGKGTCSRVTAFLARHGGPWLRLQWSLGTAHPGGLDAELAWVSVFPLMGQVCSSLTFFPNEGRNPATCSRVVPVSGKDEGRAGGMLWHSAPSRVAQVTSPG